MSEMVERVAAMIWITLVTQNAAARGRDPKSIEDLLAEWHKDVTDPDNGFYRPIYEDLIEQAEAAILAMREPTEALEAAGDRIIGDCAFSVTVWQAMIDEALR